MVYRVPFSYGGVVIIEASSKEEAYTKVEDMSDKDLFLIARDGLEIDTLSIEELDY